MISIDIYQHTTTRLNLYVADVEGLTITLLGMSVMFLAKTTIDGASYSIEKSCDIISEALGTVGLTLTTVDTGETGVMYAEILVTNNIDYFFVSDPMYLLAIHPTLHNI